jgi:hypothetical protein
VRSLRERQEAGRSSSAGGSSSDARSSANVVAAATAASSYVGTNIIPLNLWRCKKAICSKKRSHRKVSHYSEYYVFIKVHQNRAAAKTENFSQEFSSVVCRRVLKLSNKSTR